MTKEVIKPMKYGGCWPGNRTWWEKIIGFFFIAYSGMTVMLHFLNFVFDSNLSMGKFTLEFAKLSCFLQILAKSYTAVTKGNVIRSMLETLWNDFWLINRLDDKHKKNALTYYTFAKRISDIYSIVVLCAASLFILQAGLKMDKSLVDDIWIPHKEVLKISPYYEIVFAVQALTVLTLVFFYIQPIDVLFIQLIFCVCVQFKILREEMKLLNYHDDSMGKKSIIKRIVKQHNILIRFVGQFEEVYSKSVLLTLATNYIIITMSMFGIMYEVSMNEKIAYIFIYLTCLVQIFAFCLAGQLVHDQSKIVGEAAYEIEWYVIPNLQVRKDIMFIIQRSHLKMYLTAGGIMPLNMESFHKVSRKM